VKKLFATLVFLATVLVAPAAAAEGDTAETVVAAVEAKYGPVQTVRAEFTQTTRSAAFGDDVQRGYVVLKRPDKMRWAFEGGAREFVTDGSAMWMYTKADNQVLKYPSTGESIETLLGSFDRIDEQFGVRLVESTAERTMLELTPKGDAGVKTIRVVLDAERLVKHLTLVDPFDTVTEVDLTKVELGVEVPDSAFEFVPPAGAEVIEAGAM
jgi:outer membrane lipoprotein carrier protein